MGSTFYPLSEQIADSIRAHEDKVTAAYQACKRLGMDCRHGL